jgi:hypothetical protein
MLHSFEKCTHFMMTVDFMWSLADLILINKQL